MSYIVKKPENNMQSLKYAFANLLNYVSLEVSIFIWFWSFYSTLPIL